MLATEVPANFKRSLLIVLSGVSLVVALLGIWLNQANLPIDRSIDGMVIQQIQSASELTSAIVNTEQIVEKDEKGSGFLWHDRKVLYVAKGKVRVGIDLSEISEKSMTVEGKMVKLTLPPLRVLESELDSEKSYAYSVDAGLIPATQDILNLVRKAQLKAKQQIAEAACSDWIIDAANLRTRKTLTQILNPVLKPLGYEAVVQTQPFSAKSCSSRSAANGSEAT